MTGPDRAHAAPPVAPARPQVARTSVPVARTCRLVARTAFPVARTCRLVASARGFWSRALLVAYTAFVLVVTWWPSPQSTDAPQWETTILDAIRGVGIPMTMPVLEALANVGMFVPLGMLLVPAWSARLNRRDGATAIFVRTVLAGATLTVVIETVQLAIPGRYSTVQDVIMNTLGAAVGGGAVLLARRLRRG